MADEPVPTPAAPAAPAPPPKAPVAPAAAAPPAPTTAPVAAPKPPPAPRPKTKTTEIEALLNQHGAKAQHLDDTDPNIPTILLDKTVLMDSLRRLKFEFRFEHLACLTAIDAKENFEVVYNLWSYSRNKPIGVKVRVARADATVPSITSLWIGANWLEREEWDLMGIKFDGHPNMKRMFLPDGWQGHPLRKDYDLKKEQYVALNDDGEDVVYPEPREGAW